MTEELEFCTLCGKSSAETTLGSIGHGEGIPVCDDNTTCDPMYYHPRRRVYAELTPEVLDELENKADNELFFVDIDPAVLHSLIREARKLV